MIFVMSDVSVNTVWWSKWEELLYSLSWECVTFLVQFMLGSGSVFEFSDPKSGFRSRLQKAWIQIRIRIHGSKKGGSNGFRIRFRIRIQSPVKCNLVSLRLHSKYIEYIVLLHVINRLSAVTLHFWSFAFLNQDIRCDKMQN